MAMLLQEYRSRGCSAESQDYWIDISKKGVKKGRRRQISSPEMEQLPMEWRKKYCHIDGDDTFVVEPQLKCNVRFIKHNLMERVSDKYDLILCRNVMIYFDRDSQKKADGKLEECLNPGSYLLIGHAKRTAVRMKHLWNQYIRQSIEKYE